ncbi:hypothetical protein VTN77DRAFT_5872 [Rasamsonia byssochlamydoides]|uniref:uncharacterized protein n=1 Tax=Rasamsonia byssochlamydoides TaxID=89139 RepID=UPI0037443F6E
MSPTQFASDDTHPVISEGGGVYSRKERHNEKAFRKERHNEKAFRTQKTPTEKISDIETGSGETLLDERDLRKKQEFKGWTVVWLAYQSIGVIYGDIGTSPLYVYSSTFSAPPSYDDLVGALSLIIYALTIMVTIKYVVIVLNADDEGEGGTFALYSLISRYARLVSRHPREEAITRIERHRTGDMPHPNSRIRSMIENSSAMKWLFKTCCSYSTIPTKRHTDGVLTPAQSILGAIQGLTVVNENISTSLIVGVSCAILILIFLIQPFGTAKIAITFAPIVISTRLELTSAQNLALYDASVLKAFSPYFAGNYLVRNGRNGWLSIGGILLAFTGVEAMFADLGAFSKRAIQLSWLCFAYPCLLLAYIGQAAYISRVPSAYANPFYTVPPGMFYPSLVMAILACIVASQAVITGSFQLLSQIMKLSYFPQIELIHTSEVVHHQVYVPLANWIMLVGTVIVTAVYNNTTKLGDAYGSCVILVSFLTTCMVTIVAIIVWRFPIYLVLPVFIVFALWDGVFLSAALNKVPDGAWFTLAVAVVLCSIFILWRFGKEQQWKSEAIDSVPLSRTLQLASDLQGDLRLQPTFGGSNVLPLKGLGIFFDKAGNPAATPLVFLHFLQRFTAMPQVTVFFHLRPLGVPTVAPDDRFTVNRCYAAGPDGVKRAVPNCYRIIVRHGYTDEVVTPDLGRLVTDHIQRYLQNEDEEGARGRQQSKVIYIVGKEQLRIHPSTNPVRRFVLGLFLWLRENTRTKVQHLNVEVDRLVEVGFIKDI